MTDQRRDNRPISEEEMVEEIAEGKATREQLDKKLRQREAREAAEREDQPDSTEQHTAGGFGSGQGMGTEETGQEPDRPDEQGFPRGKDKEWPH